ncbi:MAG TPA: AraC family transcriptional regulator [Streptosporangiaceae bacterium]|nr:AraC family transcriptional regulator [Streptosporangiaceae bacterium]
MERLNTNRDDGLSVLLREVNVRSVVYCVSDFAAPWGFEVERSPVAKFHVVLHGAASLALGDGKPVALASGDLVLLPHGDGHIVQDQPGSPARPLDQILADHPVDGAGRLSYGGGGPCTRLLCGGFELRPSLPDGLAEILPVMLVLDAAAAGLARWLEPLFALLREETEASAPGASAIFAKLADVFLSQALRSYLAAADPVTALEHPVSADPDIARVLRLLRSQPEVRWTLDDLARAAGMSRTSFTVRFRAAVGVPPISYLTRLRLTRAAGYLATTTKNVSHVARLVGYDSDASFSKAFSRAFGRPPGDYRRDRFASPTLADHSDS